MAELSRVRFAAANRPYPGEIVSGDCWTSLSGDGWARIALADGAGHGRLAAEAATRALGLVEPSRSLAETIQICHVELHGTRGAVMSIAHIDLVERSLSLAGVGNVDAVLLKDGSESHLVTQRGMVGATLPTIRPLTIALGTEWTLVLSSDGIRSRFSLLDPELIDTADEGPDALATAILSRFARADDDATVVVAMSPRG